LRIEKKNLQTVTFAKNFSADGVNFAISLSDFQSYNILFEIIFTALG
jgi:hypothetical protein